MGKQLNFYVKLPDIEKMEKYLKDRDFLFLRDEILDAPDARPAERMFTPENRADYLILPKTEAVFRSWTEPETGRKKYRLRFEDQPVLDFDYFGQVDGLYRIRFFYDSYRFENGEKLRIDPDFERMVDRFFRWCRYHFQSVPDWRTFYQNPAHPVKEFF